MPAATPRTGRSPAPRGPGGAPRVYILSGDALMNEAKASGRFDYDKPIEGLRAVDRHTLRIRLNAPEQNFLFYLAMPASGSVAREVIEAEARREQVVAEEQGAAARATIRFGDERFFARLGFLHTEDF